jgi:RimJ/RimL family protein N-acetyltransferase
VVAETPRIETERLVLRRWDVAGDLDAYAAICGDPEVMRYIGDGSVATRDQCAEGLEQFEATWRERSFGLFAVERRDTCELIGNTGLAVPDFLPEILPAVEIGWRLGRAHWRQGFATEAARAALTFAWDPLGLDRVVSVHAVGNDASGHVMQKIGMHLDLETVHPKNGRAVRVYAIDRPLTA